MVLTVFLIILAVVAVVLLVLYIVGRRLQKKQEGSQEQLAAAAQQVTMFIIDKKMMKLKESGLPDSVMEQASALQRRAKVPVLKVKIGPQIMNLVCDNAIFDQVPVKKEVKASLSGIYVNSVKGLHGPIAPQEQTKKGRFARWTQRMQEKAGARPVK
ncbi:MAG: hypothetical protein IJP92_09365 [Lachnospiraceae bacterium]|nr:hypothetical protein [Lachnospiraceae bacterium]